LYEALSKVLTKLSQRGLQDHEIKFVENFTAIAFFRIPEFRKKLLKCLIRDDDPDINEWRGTEFLLEDDGPTDRREAQLAALFDWENEFHKYLSDSQKTQENKRRLNEILEDKIW